MTQLRDELAPTLAAKLVGQGVLPKNAQDMHALVLDMQEHKQICAVRIDQFQVSEPNPQGLIPVQVSGVCAIHNSAETVERRFIFQYLIGQRAGTSQLLLAEFNDLSPS
jgi:hypothetical protein